MSQISFPQIGNRIATLRKNRHLTQKDLAAQLNISIKLKYKIG